MARVWTAESQGGRWVDGSGRVADSDARTPGAQFRAAMAARSGASPLFLQGPGQPREVALRVSTDGFADSGVVNYVPERRSLLMAGVIEGRLDWRDLRKAELSGGSRDRFEDALKDAAFEGSNGRLTGGARSALYLKGT